MIVHCMPNCCASCATLSGSYCTWSSNQPSLQRCATNNPTLAGSAGGVVEAFCLAPIDVIKTRLQLDGTKQYRSIIHCGTSIAEKEGVKALWKGVVPFATHLTFKYALRMGSNSFYQNLMRDKEGNLNQYRRLAAGAMAGITEAVCIVTPFEVVKIRLQQQRGLDKASLKYHVRIRDALRQLQQHIASSGHMQNASVCHESLLSCGCTCVLVQQRSYACSALTNI